MATMNVYFTESGFHAIISEDGKVFGCTRSERGDILNLMQNVQKIGTSDFWYGEKFLGLLSETAKFMHQIENTYLPPYTTNRVFTSYESLFRRRMFSSLVVTAGCLSKGENLFSPEYKEKFFSSLDEETALMLDSSMVYITEEIKRYVSSMFLGVPETLHQDEKESKIRCEVVNLIRYFKDYVHRIMNGNKVTDFETALYDEYNWESQKTVPNMIIVPCLTTEIK